jgi:acetylornithine deacetylase/succinyl-diaminopimelate desuccinylase-like protein
MTLDDAQVSRLVAAAEERSGGLVELLCDLIRARSVNPPGDEHRPAAVVEKFLAGLGVHASRHEAVPGRTNLIATIGRAGGRRLLLPLHLDTVPAGEAWGEAAFEPRVEHGLVIGRGAVDDKGPLAAVLVAMQILLADADRQPALDGELVLIAAADEECGNARGMNFLLQQGLIRGDWALVPDIGHSMTALDVAEKGVCVIEIECRGRAAHGSRPQDGINAILALAELLAEIEAWDPEARHPLLGRPTSNVGMIGGGSAPNMVADRATARIDCRYLPGMNPGDVMGQLTELGRRVTGRRPGASFDMRLLTDWPPSEVDPASPIAEAVRTIAPRITGRPVELIGMGGATFCKSCLSAGIPAVGFGPGSAGAAHTAGESVEVRELVQFAAFVAALARHLLGTAA